MGDKVVKSREKVPSVGVCDGCHDGAVLVAEKFSGIPSDMGARLGMVHKQWPWCLKFSSRATSTAGRCLEGNVCIVRRNREVPGIRHRRGSQRDIEKL